MYISSRENVQAKMVTMTVHKGLNMAEKSGPLFEMHQAWAKNEIADPPPWIIFKISVNQWNIESFLFKLSAIS